MLQYHKNQYQTCADFLETEFIGAEQEQEKEQNDQN